MRVDKPPDPDGLISRSTHLRLKAIECYQNAELAKTPQARASFTFLAMAYEELAERVERMEREEAR